MHEVGHLETEWEMNDDPVPVGISNEEYYNLHDEFIATDWAGEWLEENYDRAKNFDASILAALVMGYERLGLK